jgi:hypothetical protein
MNAQQSLSFPTRTRHIRPVPQSEIVNANGNLIWSFLRMVTLDNAAPAFVASPINRNGEGYGVTKVGSYARLWHRPGGTNIWLCLGHYPTVDGAKLAAEEMVSSGTRFAPLD